MINILLPSMGNSVFFQDSYFPKLMTEIKRKTMLELVVDDYRDLDSKRHIFIYHDDDCKKFHLDASAKILEPSSVIIKLHGQTAGALCTCLMAVDYINDDTPLVIANSDQIIEVEYKEVIKYFEKTGADAGVITFPSVHPRWSYARVVEDEVVEVAEKRPISKHAIAGFYYYRRGRSFIEAAKIALMKKNSLEGTYYISTTINEIILKGKKVSFYEVNKSQYRSFYSPIKIKEYEDDV